MLWYIPNVCLKTQKSQRTHHKILIRIKNGRTYCVKKYNFHNVPIIILFQEGITCKQQMRICSMPKPLQYPENDLGWKGSNQAVRCFNFLEYWLKAIVFHIKFLMYLFFFVFWVFFFFAFLQFISRDGIFYILQNKILCQVSPHPLKALTLKAEIKTFLSCFKPN